MFGKLKKDERGANLFRATVKTVTNVNRYNSAKVALRRIERLCDAVVDDLDYEEVALCDQFHSYDPNKRPSFVYLQANESAMIEWRSKMNAVFPNLEYEPAIPTASLSSNSDIQSPIPPNEETAEDSDVMSRSVSAAIESHVAHLVETPTAHLARTDTLAALAFTDSNPARSSSTIAVTEAAEDKDADNGNVPLPSVVDLGLDASRSTRVNDGSRKLLHRLRASSMSESCDVACQMEVDSQKSSLCSLAEYKLEALCHAAMTLIREWKGVAVLDESLSDDLEAIEESSRAFFADFQAEDVEILLQRLTSSRQREKHCIQQIEDALVDFTSEFAYHSQQLLMSLARGDNGVTAEHAVLLNRSIRTSIDLLFSHRKEMRRHVPNSDIYMNYIMELSSWSKEKSARQELVTKVEQMKELTQKNRDLETEVSNLKALLHNVQGRAGDEHTTSLPRNGSFHSEQSTLGTDSGGGDSQELHVEARLSDEELDGPLQSPKEIHYYQKMSIESLKLPWGNAQTYLLVCEIAHGTPMDRVRSLLALVKKISGICGVTLSILETGSFSVLSKSPERIMDFVDEFISFNMADLQYPVCLVRMVLACDEVWGKLESSSHRIGLQGPCVLQIESAIPDCPPCTCLAIGKEAVSVVNSSPKVRLALGHDRKLLSSEYMVAFESQKLPAPIPYLPSPLKWDRACREFRAIYDLSQPGGLGWLCVIAAPALGADEIAVASVEEAFDMIVTSAKHLAATYGGIAVCVGSRSMVFGFGQAYHAVGFSLEIHLLALSLPWSAQVLGTSAEVVESLSQTSTADSSLPPEGALQFFRGPLLACSVTSVVVHSMSRPPSHPKNRVEVARAIRHAGSATLGATRIPFEIARAAAKSGLNCSAPLPSGRIAPSNHPFPSLWEFGNLTAMHAVSAGIVVPCVAVCVGQLAGKEPLCDCELDDREHGIFLPAALSGRRKCPFIQQELSREKTWSIATTDLAKSLLKISSNRNESYSPEPPRFRLGRITDNDMHSPKVTEETSARNRLYSEGYEFYANQAYLQRENSQDFHKAAEETRNNFRAVQERLERADRLEEAKYNLARDESVDFSLASGSLAAVGQGKLPVKKLPFLQQQLGQSTTLVPLTTAPLNHPPLERLPPLAVERPSTDRLLSKKYASQRKLLTNGVNSSSSVALQAAEESPRRGSLQVAPQKFVRTNHLMENGREAGATQADTTRNLPVATGYAFNAILQSDPAGSLTQGIQFAQDGQVFDDFSRTSKPRIHSHGRVSASHPLHRVESDPAQWSLHQLPYPPAEEEGQHYVARSPRKAQLLRVPIPIAQPATSSENEGYASSQEEFEDYVSDGETTFTPQPFQATASAAPDGLTRFGIGQMSMQDLLAATLEAGSHLSVANSNSGAHGDSEDDETQAWERRAMLLGSASEKYLLHSDFALEFKKSRIGRIQALALRASIQEDIKATKEKLIAADFSDNLTIRALSHRHHHLVSRAKDIQAATEALLQETDKLREKRQDLLQRARISLVKEEFSVEDPVMTESVSDPPQGKNDIPTLLTPVPLAHPRVAVKSTDETAGRVPSITNSETEEESTTLEETDTESKVSIALMLAFVSLANDIPSDSVPQISCTVADFEGSASLEDLGTQETEKAEEKEKVHTNASANANADTIDLPVGEELEMETESVSSKAEEYAGSDDADGALSREEKSNGDSHCVMEHVGPRIRSLSGVINTYQPDPLAVRKRDIAPLVMPERSFGSGSTSPMPDTRRSMGLEKHLRNLPRELTEPPNLDICKYF